MSHIQAVKAQVRDLAAVQAACRRLGLEQPVLGVHRIYSGDYRGHGVQLKGWRYPIVCDVEAGSIQYDNFGGSWGAQSELDGFLQAYSAEYTAEQARLQGYMVSEEPIENEGVRLVLTHA